MQIREGNVKIVNFAEHYATKHHLKSKSRKNSFDSKIPREFTNNCRCGVSSVKFIHALLELIEYASKLWN